jgi:hypothetical protein
MVPGCGTENFVSIETGGVIPLFVKKKKHIYTIDIELVG